MSDLLSELRRSPDGADARVADLLAQLRPATRGRTPCASEPLAAFLAAVETAESPRLPAQVPQPATGRADTDLVILLGPAPARPAGRRPALAALLGGGLWAKAALGGALAAAAVAAAVTVSSPRDVVVRPEAPGTGSTAPAPGTAVGTGVEEDLEPTPRASHAAPRAAAPAVAGHRPTAANAGAGGVATEPATPGRRAEAGDDEAGAGDDDEPAEGANDEAGSGDDDATADDDATDDDATDDDATEDDGATSHEDATGDASSGEGGE